MVEGNRMRKLVLAMCCLLPASAQWQQVTVPSVGQAASAFRTPPAGFGMLLWWNWGGPITREFIVRDLDEIHSHGVAGVLIGMAWGVDPPYLSPRFFELIRYAVEQAGQRGMKIWLADEGGYPSGFAGGKFNTDHPALRMQALVVSERLGARGGEELRRALPPETVGVLAVDRATGESRTIAGAGAGELRWRAPEGDWQVLVVRHDFRTSPTRYVNNPRPVKSTEYSLCDYLDPDAIRAFLSDVHEQYKKYIGGEFGKTVVGFFGDEPDYSVPGIAWTPRIFDEFERRKGYDIRPWVPQFFGLRPSAEVRRAQADYWDVWSDLFRDAFFRIQAEWCTGNGLAYVVHLNGEDTLMNLARTEGDFFKCQRYVTVPAVDTIWRQIWMDKVSDFPKLASSAAHLFGRPRSFTESYAIYGRGMSLEQAKWVMDYEFVRGINLILAGLFGSTDPSSKADAISNPQWAQFGALAGYANRASYLLSLGTPAAQIALYMPTTSMWLGDAQSNSALLRVERQLMEGQRDFDLIDEQALASALPLEGGAFRNLSGHGYRAVIVPPSTVISRAAIDRLRAFATAGGKVVLLGPTPSLANERTFLNAAAPPDLGWAAAEPSAEIAPRVLEALPAPDVRFDRPLAAVKYLHRNWRDGEMYFFFNESAERQERTATLAGGGRAQIWNAETGQIRPIRATAADAHTVTIPLVLEPWQTQFVVLGPVPATAAPEQAPTGPPETLAELDTGWAIDLNGKHLESALKTWADLGAPAFSGAVRYRKEFAIPAGRIAARSRIYLDCGEVRYSAHAWLNGIDLGDRVWRPFRWDITEALKPGANVLEIEVRNTRASEFIGDPEKLKQVEQQARTEGGYLARYLPFDREMILAGLLPPVRVVITEPRP
jgi:hypothetical protein